MSANPRQVARRGLLRESLRPRARRARKPCQEAFSGRPEALDALDSPEARQLYVNAAHDGTVGVITLGREAYNWEGRRRRAGPRHRLAARRGIERVVLTGDFHLTQLVGADTAEFLPALEDKAEGFRVAAA